MQQYKELKMHPSYWVLHKEFWTEEFNSLDKDIANIVMTSPYSAEAQGLEKKVIRKIEDALLSRV